MNILNTHLNERGGCSGSQNPKCQDLSKFQFGGGGGVF